MNTPHTEFSNLTPHSITVHCTDGNGVCTFTCPPSGQVARLISKGDDTNIMYIGGVSIQITMRGAVNETTDLPPEDNENGLMFIVSGMVREAHPHRFDLFSPGELIRDTAGQPIGCRGLVGNPLPIR